MAQKRKKRRAYDQTKDTGTVSGGRSGGSGYGYREQELSFETPNSQARRARDNSIEFPTAAARGSAQGSADARQRGGQNGSGKNNRNASAQTRRNRSGQNRNNNQNRNGGQNRREPQGSNRQALQQANARAPQNYNGGTNGRMRPTQANLQSPARREKRKMRRVTRAELRRRRIMRRLAAFVLLLCVIAAGGYLTVTMLFKINSIQVQTADGTVVEEAGGYTSEQILLALGVELDDNIFSFSPTAKAAALEKQFPLLEHIEVVRKYPTTVVVRVVEATPAWAMQAESGWLTLSSNLKILSRTSEQPELPTLYGGEPATDNPGDQLEFAAAQEAGSNSASAASSGGDGAAETRLSALNTLLTKLQERGLLADVTRIEFADTEQLAFLYQDRISVLLGTLNEIDYKMEFAAYLLLNTDGNGCAATDTGELDCSHLRSDGTLRPILAQGEPTLPSGYIVGVGIPEAASEEAASSEEEAASSEEAVSSKQEDTGGAGTEEEQAAGN